MKNSIILTVIMFLTLHISGQEANINKQLFNVQAGFPGSWLNCEFRIAGTVALRGEFGLAYHFTKDLYDKTVYIFVPTISVEPRWYYNVKRRVMKGKQTDNNSGNFLTLYVRHVPNWFVISNRDIGKVVPDIAFIPTWGLRRSIGEHFNLEICAGIGYRYYFAKSAGYAKNKGEADLNLGLRLGYHFLKR